MATPSAPFPLSPTPQSPLSSTDLTSTPPQPTYDAPRQNKRSSTASQGGRGEVAAAHYPSPPPGNTPAAHRSRPSFDPSLAIPPFNPNKRRSSGAGASGSRSSSTATTPSAPSRRNSAQQAFEDRIATLMPSPPLPAQYQPTHAHAHQQQQRPVSAMPQAYPQQQQQQQQYSQAGSPAAQGPGGSVSSRSRQSVGYLPTNTLAGQGPYPHLYNPHPMPKQKIYFGPYILLQTLGEGEFGKVKLGVHSERWGEDVAIKLIKRGNVDTAQRGEKVRREIEVLKLVRHPNIVRLYDVIETEKYIGIVLEYASGGELFDHILAHRYLKAPDASRLFAQLISGVSYLHQKGVVHRDLKLENLLLDRNRNVIITDFGFANRFNDADVDLMATSCGSPCYAAPELVVQDGRYVGTAVDIWSCGVILYAMLAGYLPYDDDPANPEGDNINLLYKYILNTKLTFPDWIEDEPRHLLLMMLVAEPTKRCTIWDVMRHPWLSRYAAAFDKSVPELEYQAQELEMRKRQALEIQRQWLIQQQQQQQLAAQGLLAPSMSRSQTASSMGMAGPPAPGSAAGRHRSAMVTSASSAAVTAPLQQRGFEPYPATTSQPPAAAAISEEPSLPSIPSRVRTPSVHSASSISRRAAAPGIISIPSASQNPNRRSAGYVVSSSPPTTQSEFVAAEAGPFSFETSRASPSPQLSSATMAPSLSAPGAIEDQVMVQRSESMTRSSTTQVAAGTADEDRRRKASHRATVQVEYDPNASARRSRREQREPSPLPPSTQGAVQGLAIHTEEEEGSPRVVPAMLEIPRVVRETRNVASPSPVPSMGGVSVSSTTETIAGEDVVMSLVEEEVTQTSEPLQAAFEPTPIVEEKLVEQIVEPAPPTVDLASLPPPIAARPSTPPGIPFPTPSSPTPRKRKSSGSPVPSVHPVLEPLPALPQLPAADVEQPSRAKMSNGSQASSAATEPIRAPSVASTTASRHRPAPSLDRFSIRTLLGGSLPASASERNSRPVSRVESPTTSQSPSGRETALDEVTNRRKQTRRQKALSLQPFRNSVSSKLPKQAKANVEAQISASRARSNTNEQQAMPPPALPSPRPTQPQPAWVRPTTTSTSTSSSRRLSTDLEANWREGGPASNGKAKAVMDWFRRKSTKPDAAPAQPIKTDFDDRRRAAAAPARPLSSVERPASSNTSMRDGAITPTPPAPPPAEDKPAAPVAAHPDRTPSFVVTCPAANVESQPSSRSTSGNHDSRFSNQTSSTVATSIGASPVVAQAPTATASAAAVSTFSPNKLRFHQGALDKKAVTYRLPTEVIGEIRNVLWNMGVDMAMEGEFKIKCVRKSRKKALASSTRSVSGGSHVGVATAAASAGPLDDGRRRSIIPSSPSMTQSPSMGFRSLFNRPGKHGHASPALTASPTFSAPSTPSAQQHDVDPLSSPMTTSVSQFSMLSLSHGASAAASAQPLPVYASADSGEELRWTLELTRVRGLEGLFTVECKRMKGSPFSYKHVYEQLLKQLELGEV